MIWIEYLMFFAAAFGISLLISRRLPALFDRLGIVDKKSLPERKPTAGGIAIIVPFLLIVGVAAVFNPLSMNAMQKPLIGLCLAAGLIGLLGFYDDTRGANPALKIAVQVIAGFILIAAGIGMKEITNPFSIPMQVGIWGNAILIIWLIVITNSVNLIDGIDGLAAGICLISSIALFVIAHLFGENTLAALALIIAGALFGFIRFNSPPAKIFLGDTGSLFLGFLLAAISVIERRKGIVTVTLLVPVLILAVPLVDTAMAFFRRLISGQNPMKGDRMHIHHRLINLGLPPEKVNFVLYLFSIYLAITAGVLSFFPKETVMVVVLLLAIGILMILEILRMIEKR